MIILLFVNFPKFLLHSGALSEEVGGELGDKLWECGGFHVNNAIHFECTRWVSWVYTCPSVFQLLGFRATVLLCT